MADFDPDSFLGKKPTKAFNPDEFLGAPDPALTALVDPRQTPEQRMAEKEAAATRIAARTSREKFQAQNAQGIPLDVEAELPAALRARTSFEPNIDKQVELISKQPGVLGARKSADGRNVIVRIADESGNPKEVLLNPLTSTLTAGDVAGATAPILKGAGALAVGAATGGASLPLTMASMGAYGALSEAGTTGISRALAGQDLDVPDLTKRGATQGVIDAGTGGLVAAPGAALRGVRGVLARNPSPLAKEAVAAGERTGIALFPSQALDSKALARGEELAGLSKLKGDQQKAMRSAFDREIGPSGRAGVLSESDIAKKTQPIFAADAEAAERGARITMTDAERAAQADINRQIQSGITPIAPGNSPVAMNTRTKFEDFVTKAKKQAEIDYPKFYEKAASENITLKKEPISDLVAKIEEQDPAGVAEFLAPSIRQVKTVEKKLTQPLAEAQPSGVLDDAGRPIMSEEVPSPPLTFDEAIRQRAIVRAKLDAPDDPMGDVVKSYYKQLEKAYTEAIDEGVSRGSPELKALYDTARSGYRGSAEVLEKGIIQKLFREPGEAGRVADEKVVPSLFYGGGQVEALRDIKQILGADSPDYKMLIRQGVQNMIDQAEQKGTGGLINADDFLTQFRNLSNEFRSEVFGSMEPSLRAAAETLSIAQKGADKVARIPKDELLDALAASPKNAKRLIEQAVDRQKAYEREYTTSLMQKLTGRNELGLKDLGNLDRFVTDFVPQASAQDMRQILTRIESAQPGSSDQLRQRILANVREDVLAKEPTEKLRGEAFEVVPEKIDKYISGPDAEKYRAVLGDKVITFLEDIKTLSKSQINRAEMGKENAITPRVFGKEALSGFAGFARNAISTGVDLLSILPRAIAGNAERSASVREWLTTGKWPAPQTRTMRAAQALAGAARPLALAAPELKEAKDAVLAEQP